MSAKQAFTVPMELYANDKVGEVGKAMATIGRRMATTITTTFAQEPDNYNLTITVELERRA